VKCNKIIVVDATGIGKPARTINREVRLLVYKHGWCGTCDSMIETALVGSRKFYFCGKCQA